MERIIFERKDIEIWPPELCIRVSTPNDIPPMIRELGVAVCDDDTVWVKGEYAGQMVRIEHDTTDVVDYANETTQIIVNATIVSIERGR